MLTDSVRLSLDVPHVLQETSLSERELLNPGTLTAHGVDDVSRRLCDGILRYKHVMFTAGELTSSEWDGMPTTASGTAASAPGVSEAPTIRTLLIVLFPVIQMFDSDMLMYS